MQRFFLIVALLISLPISLQAEEMPMSLPWEQKLSKSFHEIPGFKYWYGDMEWGEMIFVGNFQKLDAEVQISFVQKMISKATLILGPGGIDLMGCRNTFLNVVDLLKKKYGPWKYAKTTESEIKEDLFYTHICTPVRVGVHVEEIRWETKKFLIVAYLFGDGEDIFIEVDYYYRPLQKIKKSNKGILKKL